MGSLCDFSFVLYFRPALFQPPLKSRREFIIQFSFGSNSRFKCWPLWTQLSSAHERLFHSAISCSNYYLTSQAGNKQYRRRADHQLSASVDWRVDWGCLRPLMRANWQNNEERSFPTSVASISLFLPLSRNLATSRTRRSEKPASGKWAFMCSLPGQALLLMWPLVSSKQSLYSHIGHWTAHTSWFWELTRIYCPRELSRQCSGNIRVSLGTSLSFTLVSFNSVAIESGPSKRVKPG